MSSKLQHLSPVSRLAPASDDWRRHSASSLLLAPRTAQYEYVAGAAGGSGGGDA